MAKELRIVVPDEVYNRIMKVCKELKIAPQDIILRAIVKTLEEFEKIDKGGRR